MGDLKSYLAQVKREFGTGEATEHTHRAALKALVESFAPDVVAINEPKRVECGAPDYVVKRGDLSVGYIEAKDVGKSLDEAERSEQLDRYLRSLENLVLTDYLEFRWYHKGSLRERARLAKLTRDGKIVSVKKGDAEVERLLASFLDQSPEPITSSKELSERLARLAREIQRAVVMAFEQDLASTELRNLRRAFAEVLIPDLDQPEKTGEFADMYSQTIVYGLFAARCNHPGPEPFRRLGAARSIPRTNPFLRQLFETITGTALDDEPYVDYVEDVVTILDHTDLDSVLADFGKRTKQEDPVVHFYETFLAAYDPKLRERRGVYYTPEPVVSYIVRSVDSILKSHFGLGGGLMDSSTVEYEEEAPVMDRYGKPDPSKLPERVTKTSPKVLILDPACGTGTFLYAVIDHIRQDFMTHGNAGYWSAYVRDHLLPRIFGFELLMAPYAVAHFKLGMMLAGQDLPVEVRGTWVYDFKSDERLGVYLTNTLEEAENPWKNLWGYEAIGREAQSASMVKRDKPIMVVLGNPPYSNFGRMNRGAWILDQLKDYKKDLKEKKLNLDDDFIKFIRWGQWRIEETGYGVLAFITNNTYIDGITHRRMRQSLMETFSEIYILDLHGSTKKKECAPDGSRDENVFDIQQGVAIGIFIKDPDKDGLAKVYHSDLWGIRDAKYKYLFDNDIETMEWTELKPGENHFFFIPRDESFAIDYNKYAKLSALFRLFGNGIGTDRDNIFYNFDRSDLEDNMNVFYSQDGLKPPFSEIYNINNSSSYNLLGRRLQTKYDKNNIYHCLYRPFDLRWLYYNPGLTSRPAYKVMCHLNNTNLALLVTRQISTSFFHHVFVSKNLVDRDPLSLATRERTQVFPLYLYPSPAENSSRQKSLSSADWPLGKGGRVPNLSPEFVADFAGKLGLSFVPDGRGDREATFGPEDVFDYIYAVFHSPSYRERYAEFLKIDFPRVPLTSDREKFRKLVRLGGELVALHLLESPLLAKTITRYPVVGDNRVEKGRPKYFAPGETEPGSKDGAVLEAGRVYINKSQYFEGVPPEVWEHQVGGYQVCDKWLKDRRGRQLSYDDLTVYQRIIVALKETIRLMEEVDSAVGEWPLE
jgi:hypothetical protein